MKSEIFEIKEAVGVEKIKLADFLEVTKLRLVSLVLWSVAVGFFLATDSPFSLSLFLKALGGISLVAAGAMVLNQFLEMDADAKMKRTENRPLPSGRLKATEALFIGTLFSVAGLLVLGSQVNLLLDFLAGLTLIVYLFLYTPLKTQTPLCVWIGAIPGAMPPVLGWVARKGEAGIEAWVLFLILLVWQLPHVLAISWVHKEDYVQAGFKMLPLGGNVEEKTGRRIVFYSLVLIPISLGPVLIKMNGALYLIGAMILGIWFLASALKTHRNLDHRAKPFFRDSILYLSLLFLLLLLDKRFL
ncbi:MAG: protoheme IX farnesyltransferase [Candidatus Omnitrophica bacterium]|nr:protoheme IX farnesyltransferase [Candidatus Omnitrophota bacterium]